MKNYIKLLLLLIVTSVIFVSYGEWKKAQKRAALMQEIKELQTQQLFIKMMRGE